MLTTTIVVHHCFYFDFKPNFPSSCTKQRKVGVGKRKREKKIDVGEESRKTEKEKS